MIAKYYYLALLGAAFIACATVYYIGHRDGVRSCKADITTQTLIEVKDNDKNEQEIRTLDDINLFKRYCRGVYDMPYNECVKTIHYVK